MSDDNKLGVGIDIGTMNIVSARMGAGESVTTKRVRDAFLDLDPSARKALKMGRVTFVEEGGQLVILGDSALKMANLFKREVRRPLAKGLISAGELDAQKILGHLIFSVLDNPRSLGEHCFYSVPAEPLDISDQDVVYHTEVFRKLIEVYGYVAHPTNEAMAIVYSQCANEGFSGLAISYGSGMVNAALSYQATQFMAFSLARGGDWVDAHAAKALGATAAHVCAIKESGGFNLSSPPSNNREAEAIALYIRSLIRYSLEKIAEKVRVERIGTELTESIPLVVSGGATLAMGFLNVFNEELEIVKKKGFPIPISVVRRATDPMCAVAEGLLVLANQEHEEG